MIRLGADQPSIAKQTYPNMGSGMRVPTLALTGLLMVLATSSAMALEVREGWSVTATRYSFNDLVDRLKSSIADQKMGLVTQASASDGAKAQGLTIPGNRVLGVYRNDYARRMLDASVAAGIEAPIRFYVTENSDGTATLSYKLPSFVFAPYFDEGGESLKALSGELDVVFAAIATKAVE